MEIETIHGLIGIVHAECPVSRWGELPPRSIPTPAWRLRACGRGGESEHGRDDDVLGVEAVIVGHTPVRQVTSLGNVVFIDTGLVFGGELTILELTALVPGP